MNGGSQGISFVLAERTEREKLVSNRHFWTFVASGSKLAVYRADSGFEFLLLAPGIFISHWVRGSLASGLLGKDIDEVIAGKKRSYVFDRAKGPLRLSTKEKGVIGKRTVLVLSDDQGSTEIDLSQEDIGKLRSACPELQFDPIA